MLFRSRCNLVDAGKRLHTARSRNDQVATDVRLYLRTAIDEIAGLLRTVQRTLLDLADRHTDTIMPGFTHMQVAQPVSFAHHLMAYFEMFGRDVQRLVDCRKRVNRLPLGSAALAGSATSHRPSLEHYTLPMLDQMLTVVMACTLLAYAFYTISAETVAKFGTDHLLLTLPLPMYGLFRYLFLIHRGDKHGNPSELLLSDRPLQVCLALWGALVAVIIYGPLK